MGFKENWNKTKVWVGEHKGLVIAISVPVVISIIYLLFRKPITKLVRRIKRPINILFPSQYIQNKIKTQESGSPDTPQLESYKLDGNWAIGYGHSLGTDDSNAGTIIDKPTAKTHFRDDIKIFTNGLKGLVKVPLNQNQYDALLNTVYFIGLGNLQHSDLLTKINALAPAADIQAEFMKWVNEGSERRDSLVKRMDKNAKLWIS